GHLELREALHGLSVLLRTGSPSGLEGAQNALREDAMARSGVGTARPFLRRDERDDPPLLLEVADPFLDIALERAVGKLVTAVEEADGPAAVVRQFFEPLGKLRGRDRGAR